MSSTYPTHFFTASTPRRPSSEMSLGTHSPFLSKFEGLSWYTKTNGCILSFKPNGQFQNARSNLLSKIKVTAGQSGDPEKLNLDAIIEKARTLWDSLPQPVKSFPWNRTLENFIQLILDLTLAVIKYLCAPLLAVSSLSEMSYCAHEKKLFLVPIPLLIGIVVAGLLKDAALELSPVLKDAEVPWHLIAIAIFFTLLKLPGPYYPYWGRIFIPHFANGGLLRTLWSVFLWYRRPHETLLQQKSLNGSGSVPNTP
ncbi:hypothetical protein PVL29_003142 [Vitis rotundifolia]|uniref:Embryo defective 1273 n=1 Tax=Vitis rotundifolia TaxID=103349 RepID=A0AA39E4N4_VITRO|nr:hypothetical protein PVL29_003142 [Vitis rotundifolia]